MSKLNAVHCKNRISSYASSFKGDWLLVSIPSGPLDIIEDFDDTLVDTVPEMVVEDSAPEPFIDSLPILAAIDCTEEEPIDEDDERPSPYGRNKYRRICYKKVFQLPIHQESTLEEKLKSVKTLSLI